MEMNRRSRVHHLMVSAAFCAAVVTAFAQNPPQGAGAAAPPGQQANSRQQGRGAAAVGQIPIPLPCTPEQIAAAQSASGPGCRPRSWRRRGGGTPCHMPDPREGLKAGSTTPVRPRSI